MHSFPLRPTALLAALLVTTCTVGAAESGKRRPNVLFIAVDDLKPMLGCYGDATVKSPNIDRLANRGMVFEMAYANQAVCAPSRNSLLTGIRPQTLGIYDLGTNFRKARPNAVTLPQAFKQNGYRAEAIGKLYHVGHGNTEDPASWSVPHFQAKTVDYVLPENRAARSREEAMFENQNPSNLPRGAAYESADVPDDTYADGKIALEAVRRLKMAKERNEPFFIAIGFLKPHLPFCAPKKYWDLYDPSSFKLATRTTPPEGAPTYAPTNWGELRNYTKIPDKGPVPESEQRALIHGYHAAVSYMDAQLGLVLDELDRTGLAETTVIVLWGDHGWHLGDHGMWSKHSNYEQAARLPLIVVAPGVTKAGTKTRQLVETVDLYPTLCELAGVETPKDLEGRSFVPTLKDPAAPTKESIFHVFPRGERIGRAVRTAQYRMVEWKKPGAAPESADVELYDYEADPEETKNLAADQPQTVSRLRAILAAEPEAVPQIRDDAQRSNKQKQDRSTLFQSKDTDSDGKLTFEEFMAGQADPDEAPKRFKSFDVNNDGTLSRDEFVAMGRK